MSKTNKRKKQAITVVILFAICMILFALYAKCAEDIRFINEYRQYEKGDAPDTLEKAATSTKNMEMLHTSGTDIVDSSGEIVVLNGVNLGGWLLQEAWMCPVKGDDSIEQWTHLETIQKLSERFGKERAYKLLSTYKSNWITEEDLQNIAAMGYNCIRVPFSYWDFMDAEGNWLFDEIDTTPGFKTFDWLVDEARSFGLYIVLDMHACPGGQSADHVSGSARRRDLFDNNSYLNAMESLWTAIAERYCDDPVIAAYDIMNEPEADETAETIETDIRNIVYDRMIKAIRTVDHNHIITVEGIWDLAVLPDPKEVNWSNVVYQVHAYSISDINKYIQDLERYSEQYEIPVYVGEYSDLRIREVCHEHEISNTSWTYKGTNYAEGTWYMYYSDHIRAADICNDPFWMIKYKWGKCLKTNYFEKSSQYK